MKLKVLAALVVAGVTAAVLPAGTGRAQDARGSLVITIEEGAGHVRTQAWVELRSGRQRVDMASLPHGAKTGDIVTFSGSSVTGVVARVAAAAQPMTGIRNVVVVIASNATTPATTTEAEAQALLGQLNTYFVAASNGKMAITGDVRSLTVADIGCDNFFDLTKDVASQVAAKNYQHIVTLTGAACGRSGYATLGGRDAVIFGTPSLEVVAHEMGHNLGLEHAGALACSTDGVLAPFAADIAGDCEFDEYGDASDAMGNRAAGAYSARSAFSLGWLDTAQVAVNAQGAVRLAPYGTPGAVTAAYVGDGVGGEAWIEYRTATAGAPLTPDGQVQVRWSQREPKDSSIEQSSTVLLDLTPGSLGATDASGALVRSMADAGLHVVGASVTVLGTLRLTLLSRDASGAVVEITGGDTTLGTYRSPGLTLSGSGGTIDATWERHPAADVLGLREYIVEVLNTSGVTVKAITVKSSRARITAPAAGRYFLRVTPVFAAGTGSPTTLAFAVSKDRTATAFPLGHGNQITVAEGPRSLTIKLPTLATVTSYDVVVFDTDTGADISTQTSLGGSIVVADLDPTKAYIVSVEALFTDGSRSNGLFFTAARPRAIGPRVTAVPKGKNVTVTFKVAASLRKTCTTRPKLCTPTTAKVQLRRGTSWATKAVKVPANGRIAVTLPRKSATAVRVVIGRSMSETVALP